ncbi:MAG: hypothetical protein E6R05_05065 [Candidatus Moraniibacteriota bacterium]|nr:MAG: hypothetical protein E6R05_05065 [Candidatus Moranbacteria bacterium]
MKYLKNLWAAMVALPLAIGGNAFAQTFKVNGEGGDKTGLNIKNVTATSVDIEITAIAAVWKANPGANYGAKGLPSEDQKGRMDYVLVYQANPSAFAGAKQCILKRGADWPGTADLKSLKLDDPRVVCSAIDGANGTYSVKLDDGGYNLLGVIPVIEFKDGTRAWGSHPFGQSRGKNMKGQTITLLEVARGANNAVTAVVPASDAAKKFFAGQFQ